MREKHTMSLEHGIYEDLKRLSEATRINLSRLMDEALEDLFEKHNLEELWKEHSQKVEEKTRKKLK